MDILQKQNSNTLIANNQKREERCKFKLRDSCVKS